MKISTRLALQSTILTFVAAVILLFLVSFQIRSHALTEAAERAKLILAEKQAIIQYTVNNLRPSLNSFTKDLDVHPNHFDPTWMSAGYINRTVQNYFNQSEFKDYYYKNAAINARNPNNEASSYEVAFLQEVAKDTSISSRTSVEHIQGKPFFVYMQLNESRFSGHCMRCHNTPEDAPADLLDIYGNKRGFNKKPGEIASVLSLRIPLDKAYAYTADLTYKIVGVLSIILALTFCVQWFLTRRNVVSPLRTITNKALAISKDESQLGESIEIKGTSELSEMAAVFSAMSSQLAVNKNLLEKDVREKTTELVKSRIRYQTLFNKMQEGFVLHELIFDDTGNAVDSRFLAVNPSFESLTGLQRIDVVGKTLLEVMPETESYWIKMAELVVKSKKATQFENYSKDLQKYLETVIFNVENDRYAIIFRDVTERRKAEAKATVLEDKLKQAHKMEALGTLAGGIAHDFNNILSAVLGYAEMAEQEVAKNHPSFKMIVKIQQAGNRAKELVSHILAFSRKSDHRRQPVEPSTVIEEVMALLRPTIPANIEIKTRITPELGNVFIDPTQLHQVVMNLCTNAYQAMENQGGILSLYLDCKELTRRDLAGEYSMAPGSYIRLRVIDTGPGIQPGNQNLVFDPYFTTKEIGKGSGLGLSVAHGIVKSNGGLISFESSKDQGTAFTILLPKVNELESSSMNGPKTQTVSGTGNIMLIDDEQVLVEMTAIRLKRIGYEVHQFTNSQDALANFTAQPFLYDAVITDQTMPNMTGDVLAKKMLAIRPDLPIILCTGFSSRVNNETAQDLGIKAFVMKPVDQARLSEILQKVLNGST